MPSHPSIDDLGIDNSQLFSDFWKSMPSELLNQLDLIFNLGKVLLIITMVYISIMILIKLLSLIFGSKESRRLNTITKQLDEVIKILSKEKTKVENKKEKK